MALVKPVVFQVVGYQNSGKTTVMSQLISRLKAEEINVVSIKHHGHGGKPHVDQKKDSSKHLDSGALASLVEGDGSLLLQADKPFWTVEEKIQLASFFHPDVILMEGFKRELFPKLLLIRKREDLKLLKVLRNIKTVIFWDEMFQPDSELQREIPWFHIDDKSSIEWVTCFLKSQLIS